LSAPAPRVGAAPKADPGHDVPPPVKPPVFLYRPDGYIDYAAMRNAITKGTKTQKQIAAAKARAEAKAAKARKQPDPSG
jgi:hypothetical protein